MRAHAAQRGPSSRRICALLGVALFLVSLPPPSPGQPARVYVRRIEFAGVTHSNDEVLRRELLQLESTYLNSVALERSLARLERLPFVSSATARLQPVGKAGDLVDVVIEIVEAPARRYGIGGAYTAALRGRLNGYYVDENLGGTGRRFEIRAEGNELFFAGEIGYVQPYARPTGVSRTIAASARRFDRLTVDSSSLDAELRSVRLEYSYRVGDAGDEPFAARPLEGSADLRGTRLAFGVEVGRAKLAAGPETPAQLKSWIAAADADADPSRTAFTTADFTLRWRSDTRDAATFATRGGERTVAVRATLPGSDVRYWRIDYDAARYWALGPRWTAGLTTRLGIAGALDEELPSAPPYLNRLAGGPATVRGYRDGTLGPRDSAARPYGGDLLVAAQAEWLTPWPRRFEERLRTGFFYDVGNVFSADDTAFADETGAPLDYGFDATELRQSIGIVARIRIPLGMLAVSYALPLDARRHAASPFARDDLERLQLTIGVDF